MRNLKVHATSVALLLLSSVVSRAQQTGMGNEHAVVPPLVNFSGVLSDGNGKPLTELTEVTFRLYRDPQGREPLWTETQNVQPDQNGHYWVMLGSATNAGLPSAVFAAGEARWLGIEAEGQPEQPRVLLVSVPYALKAVDAQTVGGLPPSAFVLAAPASGRAAPASVSPAAATPALGGSGTADFIPLWTDSSGDLGNSVMFQSGSGSTARIGINTTAPAATLDVGGGAVIRGLELPNTGTATAASGFNSDAFDLLASTFDNAAGKAVSQIFQWQAEPTGNNTASPSGTLNLLFGAGAKPAETGLHIAGSGQITFASGQTFPGAGTITGVTAGTDLTGGGASGAVTLSLDTAKVPQLAAANTFTANQTVNGTVTATSFSGNGAGVTNVNASQLGGLASSAYAQLAAANTFTGKQTINNTTVMSGTNTAGVLQVTNTATSGKGPAIVGTTNSSAANAIKGIVTAATGTLAGVLGQTSSPTGYGVNGNASAGGTGVYGSGGIGVEGISTGTSAGSYGVYGVLSGPSALGSNGVIAAVWGDTSLAPGGSFGSGTTAVLGTADQGAGGAFYNTGKGDLEPVLVASNLGSNSTGPVFQAGGAGGFCNIYANGELACSGSKSAAVPVDGGARRVALYAVEAPENWFEDIGSAQLSNGSARVDLDPTFAQTVNTSMEYHVFLTPNGDCKGLYVSRKSATSFEVHELGAGQSNIAFDYRIVAKRSGYENIRLADFTGRFKVLEAQRERMRQSVGQRHAQASKAEPAPAAK